MSERDAQILKRANLSQSEAAELIGVHRQAISRGVKSPDSNYLTIDNLLTISSRLSESKDDRSTRVRELIIEYYPKAEALVNELSKGIDGTDPTLTPFEELWVFSSLPKECSSNTYLEGMLKHFSDPKRTIFYFTPPGFVAEQLKSVLSRTLKGCDPKSTANILIFSTKIVLYSPHFAIIDPEKEEAMGWVLTKSGSFYALPDRQVKDTVVAVRQFGISVVPIDQLAKQPNIKDPKNLFTMEYWNHEK